jgi:hypothetical protein
VQVPSDSKEVCKLIFKSGARIFHICYEGDVVGIFFVKEHASGIWDPWRIFTHDTNLLIASSCNGGIELQGCFVNSEVLSFNFERDLWPGTVTANEHFLANEIMYSQGGWISMMAGSGQIVVLKWDGHALVPFRKCCDGSFAFYHSHFGVSYDEFGFISMDLQGCLFISTDASGARVNVFSLISDDPSPVLVLDQLYKKLNFAGGQHVERGKLSFSRGGRRIILEADGEIFTRDFDEISKFIVMGN